MTRDEFWAIAHGETVSEHETEVHCVSPSEFRRQIRRAVNGIVLLLVYGAMVEILILLYLVLKLFHAAGTYAPRMSRGSTRLHDSHFS
jgi:hypothetical protein